MIADSSLVTQGTVDWTSIASTGISFGASVLSRLAAANIQPHTLGAGCHIASAYQLSPGGRHLLQEALADLPYFSGLSDAVYFGFGTKHIVRTLAEKELGQNLLALCSGLVSFTPISSSSDILFALARVLGVPDSIRPSPQQWADLLNTCGGLMISTKFTRVAGHFLSLCGQNSFRGTFKGNFDHNYGGEFCGWIAAFGQEMLGLEVEIRGYDGEILYQSTDAYETIKLFVCYADQNSSDVYQVSRKAYFIESFQQILNDESTMDTDSVLSGTLAWGSCLSSMWGGNAERVIGPGSHLARIIQLSARIFEGVVNREQAFDQYFARSSDPTDFYRSWPAYQPGQYGRGFVQTAAEWFPELDYLKSVPYNVEDLSMRYALIEFQELMAQMLYRKAPSGADDTNDWDMPEQATDSTTDYGTSEGGKGYWSDPETREKDLHEHNTRIASKTYFPRGQFDPCSFILSIIFLTWNLSFVKLDSKLEPYASGLDFVFLYVQCLTQSQCEWEDYSVGDNDIFNEHFPNQSIYAIRLIKLLNMGSVYYTAQHLFTADPGDQYETAFAAVVTNGLCFYFDILRSVTDKAEVATTLHILRGGIETSAGRSFRSITNITGSVRRGCMWRYDERQSSRLMVQEFPVPRFRKNYFAPEPAGLKNFIGRDLELRRDTGSQAMRVRLVVEESTKGLRADFLFESDSGECVVGVYTLLWELITSTQLGGCPHGPGAGFDLEFVKDGMVVDSEGKLPNGHPKLPKLYIYRLSGNRLARCVALFFDPRGSVSPVILRSRGCIECCIGIAHKLQDDEPALAIL